MEPGTIENLIDFALENYGAFNFFPREQIRAFFEIHQETTVIKKKDGRIQGFLVWEYRGADAIEIIGTAAIGSRFDNVRLFWNLWDLAKIYLPGKRIYWRTADGRIKELKCRP